MRKVLQKNDIDTALDELLKHSCSYQKDDGKILRVVSYDEDIKRMILGWYCVCGKKAVFNALKIKPHIKSSRWGELFQDTDGRGIITEVLCGKLSIEEAIKAFRNRKYEDAKKFSEYVEMSKKNLASMSVN